jgi:hypothetical protein
MDNVQNNGRAHWATCSRPGQVCFVYPPLGVCFCSLLYGVFSVTRLYSIDDRVISEWWWTDEDKHLYLKRDSNRRSQRSSGQGLRLRQRGHWDRHTRCSKQSNIKFQKHYRNFLVVFHSARPIHNDTWNSQSVATMRDVARLWMREMSWNLSSALSSSRETMGARLLSSSWYHVTCFPYCGLCHVMFFMLLRKTNLNTYH